MAFLTASTQTHAAPQRSTLMNDLRAGWTRYKLYNRTLREMRALSDRELADLGLTRGELRHVARRAVEDRV